MRSVSGARNRLVLVIAGIIALVAAAWLGAAALQVADRFPQLAPALPAPDATPAGAVTAAQSWALPVAIAVTVVVLVIGTWLLLAQIPTRAATAPLQFSDEDAATLGTLTPAVLERALAERVEGVSGVLDASVQVTGSTTSPWVQATVTIAEDAETGWAAESARTLLAEDVATVLGIPARQVDLLIHLKSSAATSSRAVLSGGQASRQEATGSPATAQA